MQMLEKVGRGWGGGGVIVRGSKKGNINIERPFHLNISRLSSISHMRINSERASLLCERSVSPQQGCILGVWRVNKGTFFCLEGRQSKFPASASTRWGKSSHVLHSVKRYYLDAIAGWICYEVSFQTDTKSQSLLLLNCLTATASFPQVLNKPTTFQQHSCDLWRFLVNLEPPLQLLTFFWSMKTFALFSVDSDPFPGIVLPVDLF